MLMRVFLIISYFLIIYHNVSTPFSNKNETTQTIPNVVVVTLKQYAGNKTTLFLTGNQDLVVNQDESFSCKDVSALSSYNLKEGIKEGSLLITNGNREVVPARNIKTNSEGVVECAKLLVNDILFQRPQSEGIVIVKDGCTETLNKGRLSVINATPDLPYYDNFSPVFLTYFNNHQLSNTLLPLAPNLTTTATEVFNVQQQRWVPVMKREAHLELNSFYLFNNSTQKKLKLDTNMPEESILHYDGQNTITSTKQKNNINKSVEGFNPGHLFNSNLTFHPLIDYHDDCLLVKIILDLFFVKKCKFKDNPLIDAKEKFVMFDKENNLVPLNMLLSPSLIKSPKCSVIVTDENGILKPTLSFTEDAKTLLFSQKDDISFRYKHLVLFRDTGQVDFSSFVLSNDSNKNFDQLLSYNSKRHAITFLPIIQFNYEPSTCFIPVTNTLTLTTPGIAYNKHAVINTLKVQGIEFNFNDIKPNSVLSFDENKCTFIPLNFPNRKKEKLGRDVDFFYFNSKEEPVDKVYVPFPCTNMVTYGGQVVANEYGQWTKIVTFTNLDVYSCLKLECTADEPSMFQLKTGCGKRSSTITTVSSRTFPKHMYLFLDDVCDQSVFLFAKSISGNLISVNQTLQFTFL